MSTPPDEPPNDGSNATPHELEELRLAVANAWKRIRGRVGRSDQAEAEDDDEPTEENPGA
jgi:hypothetical protein